MNVLFLEGIDGVGKSTAVQQLVNQYGYKLLQPEIDREKVFALPPEIKSEILKSSASMFFNVIKMLKD